MKIEFFRWNDIQYVKLDTEHELDSLQVRPASVQVFMRPLPQKTTEKREVQTISATVTAEGKP